MRTSNNLARKTQFASGDHLVVYAGNALNQAASPVIITIFTSIVIV